MKIIKFKMSRTRAGIIEKLYESIEILKTSIWIVEELKNNSFLNVIAVQLRILLCDFHKNENISIIKQLYPEFSMQPIKKQYNKNSLESGDIFNREFTKIPLTKWLQQDLIEKVIEYPFPKEVYCTSCNRIHYLKEFHDKMEVEVEDELIILFFSCLQCSFKNKIDITRECEGDEIILLPFKEKIKVIDIIKNCANKNGGAHVDISIPEKSFASIMLGEPFLVRIAQEVINELKPLLDKEREI